jgi:hypothetical protein
MGGLDIARGGERQKRPMKSLKRHDESQGEAHFRTANFASRLIRLRK